MNAGASDIAVVLEHYGGQVPRSHRWKAMRCIFHDEKNPSASVNTDTGKFKCFVCDFHGDALDVIMKKEACDFASAKSEYETISGSSLPAVPGRSGHEPRSRRVPFDEGTVTGQRDVFSARVRRQPFAGS